MDVREGKWVNAEGGSCGFAMAMVIISFEGIGFLVVVRRNGLEWDLD